MKVNGITAARVGDPLIEISFFFWEHMLHTCGYYASMADYNGHRIFSAVPVRKLLDPVISEHFGETGFDPLIKGKNGISAGIGYRAGFIIDPSVKAFFLL